MRLSSRTLAGPSSKTIASPVSVPPVCCAPLAPVGAGERLAGDSMRDAVLVIVKTGVVATAAAGGSRRPVVFGCVPPVERVRERLAQLARAHGRVAPDAIVIDVPLTHELLASMVGLARETVTVALAAWRGSGVGRVCWIAKRTPDEGEACS